MRQLTLADIPFPENLMIERQVLSDAVFNPELFPELSQFVSADMFYNEDAKRIWETMVQMYNRGEVIDASSLSGRYGRIFTQLAFGENIVPGTYSSSIQHAQILRDNATKRNAYKFAVKLLEASVKAEATEDDMAILVESAGEQILSGTTESAASVSKIIGEVADELQKEAELRKQGKSLRIRSGLQTLDWNIYQGWGPGQLIILAARPSVGKTALMLQFAMAAAESGKHTQIFTLEMTRQELLKRMLFSTGMVRPDELATGQTGWSSFERAAGSLSSLPLKIDHKSKHLTDICSKIRRAHNAGECDIAFIDYLGLIKGNGREQRYREVADITGDLKSLALELEIPIILLCQLSRLMARESRAPELTDLRESGDIEQDADIVLMLEQTEELMSSSSPYVLNLWVRKNRQYKKDFKIRLQPNDTYSKFYEIQNQL